MSWRSEFGLEGERQDDGSGDCVSGTFFHRTFSFREGARVRSVLPHTITTFHTERPVEFEKDITPKPMDWREHRGSDFVAHFSWHFLQDVSANGRFID